MLLKKTNKLLRLTYRKSVLVGSQVFKEGSNAVNITPPRSVSAPSINVDASPFTPLSRRDPIKAAGNFVKKSKRTLADWKLQAVPFLPFVAQPVAVSEQDSPQAFF